VAWKPGQSGNPGGRPKRKPIAELLLAELEKATGKSDVTKMEKLAARLVSIALSGNRSDSIAAIRLIMSYTDGLPAQSVEIDVYDAARALASERGLDPEKVVAIYDTLKGQRGGWGRNGLQYSARNKAL
jgi:hypothetical protein